VDDSEDNCDMYEQVLLHEGWRVACARDGEDGLTQARAKAPSIIVLDLGLPKLDGWEVATHLRADARTRAIPILAVTAHVTRASRERARDAGVNEFISKPCLPTDLVAAIKRHLT
jgi:two-component system, cell cycle response regulator DivK